jgi:hypothetical protein
MEKKNMVEQLTDEYSNVHRLAKVLGRGGQGIVYRTMDSDIAIKLVTDHTGEPLNDQAEIDKMNERIKAIRYLPVPEDLPLARPVAPLKGNAGYVMRLLNGMNGFDSFGFTMQSFPTDEALPTWLQEGVKDDFLARQLQYYSKTGGLRRRLSVLSQAASILGRLHASGLVYGDINHNNLFVSESLDDPVVWFIDADNLRYAGNNPGIYFPGYGAPEIVRGENGGTFFSDCYAFACLAFRMLTIRHPFDGKALSWDDADNDEDDWDEEPMDPMQKAYMGMLPFIDDPDDDSNQAGGVPREVFINPSLKTLFEKVFCEGRHTPEVRPPALLWARELAAAADQCVVCPGCSMSYYYTEAHCPYCDHEKPRMLVTKAYPLGMVAGAVPRWIFARELGETLRLPQRLFHGFNAKSNGTAEIELFFLKNEVLIEKSEGASADLSIDGNPLAMRTQIPICDFSLGTKTRRVSISIGGGA